MLELKIEGKKAIYILFLCKVTKLLKLLFDKIRLAFLYMQLFNCYVPATIEPVQQ